ncbi:SDR family NAD(P)-dependent oxidoreductase [Protaetiibacter intestinalis]|uniref:Probable oxidoreductase n=1 Tax=Protaetiibacter intestinalis TaxID=2419774 RepID=A0A387BFD9_9MICO|nr:SDR family NAD(P)-dependent oxidoreductase [Protaetiibacter intestinalis]AYF97210.1 SDR family NAD(P)-dependent oxidoreductase [Protaetiibacter intestinalis]
MKHERESAVRRPVRSPFSSLATADEVLAGRDLSGKRIIVTGGASGLGAASVRALASAGAMVTIATRNAADADDIARRFELVDGRVLDLGDLQSVRRFVSDWSGPVDVLIANAGVMALPERKLTASGWEMQLGVNFLGHFALAYGLHEQLAQANGRVVIVSSGAQLRAPVDLADLHFDSRPYDPWVAYAQSKSADVLLSVGITRRWMGDGITANACSPGAVHTQLQRHIPAEAMRQMGAMDDRGNLIHGEGFKTPEQGAATPVFLATSPLVEGVSGAYFEDNQESAVVDGGPEPRSGVARWSLDPARADALWELASLTVERETRAEDRED